ncbi:hypothetical protein OE88DRAFT_1726386 [Heliocybe sulcata]|uniref:Uncharacterized protein n=1 Tax=Heliocybe sulcata TaxID=5364 RepID=A0A5C3N027_9AGAM|nr:hypothetical protein OE88DRAFT_1726386 [Heliocybe sulcata]
MAAGTYAGPSEVVPAQVKELAVLVKQSKSMIAFYDSSIGAATNAALVRLGEESILKYAVSSEGDSIQEGPTGGLTDPSQADLCMILGCSPRTDIRIPSPLVVVHTQPTQFDEKATLHIGAPVEEVLRALITELRGAAPHATLSQPQSEEEAFQRAIPKGSVAILNEGLPEELEGEGDNI